MPSIRIGFSTDFNLVGEQVGIGTTNPAARLEVAGPILADNTAGSGGISTLTRYDGFLQPDQRVVNTVSIAETTKGNLNSLSGEIKIEGEVTVESGTTITGGRLDSLTVTDKFAVPLGDTNSRDNTPEAGTTRFNQDFGTLEFFDGVNWKTVNSYARYDAAGRGVNLVNNAPAYTTHLEYNNIMTLGNAQDFGNLETAREPGQNGCSSSVRGLWGGGEVPGGNTNDIDYITLAPGSTGQDFGDLTVARGAGPGSCSSSTRGLWAGGRTPTMQNTIDYVEIPTTGNALDFGDLTNQKNWLGSFSSPTKGFWAGGTTPSYMAEIEVVTIASKGNAVDFGDMTRSSQVTSCVSNHTRGIMAGGQSGPSGDTPSINYITMATQGNATEFGNLTKLRRAMGGMCTLTRGIFSSGQTSGPGPTYPNIIDYITIASTGDAQDFGDSGNVGFAAGVSDSHGGLGGF